MPDPVRSVPDRHDDNLIVAAYNIQWLGSLDHDLAKLAEVVRHFDVCGLVEVKDEDEIPLLVQALDTLTGSEWGYVHGVRTRRPGGSYYEAFGFVWRRDRAQLGNGVVSNIWDRTEKFRNDPFVASFQRKNFDFVMGLLHTRWTEDAEGSRPEEIEATADQIRWMRDFISETDLLLSGDFNYSGSAPEMEAMASKANLRQLDNDALSTFKTDGSGFKSAYDHIYVGDEGKGTFARLRGECTTLDVCYLVYGDNDPGHMQQARSELSDHLPVFAEFDVG